MVVEQILPIWTGGKIRTVNPEGSSNSVAPVLMLTDK